MRICKYCKKPISDNDVWNPDSEGNGYHHACLCEMEFRSKDRQIYDKGRADVLDKLRAEIAVLDDADYDYEGYYKAVTDALKIIDKYRAESENKL